MKELTIDELFEEKRFAPTAEQTAILEAAKSSSKSLMIEAFAGCSKTSTIEILGRSLPVRPSVYVVFNKRNKVEAEERFKSLDSPWAWMGRADHINVVTANGLGHNAWAKATGRRLILNDKKLFMILKRILEDEKERDFDRDHFVNTLSLVRRARVAGLIPSQLDKKGLIEDTEENWQEIARSLWLDEVTEDCFYYAHRTLLEAIRQSYQGVIDFDDQIYMSALFNGVFPRYPVLYGDEVQDYSPLNQKQIALTAADRLILVGDHRQAIYAFRGADSESIESLRNLRKEWIDLPLSTTFRCPRMVVARQQNHAPGFQAYHTNKEGTVHDWTRREWSITEIPATEKVAILCRNNAPLFAAALRCIKAGRGVTILGNEIGRGLITLAKSLAPETASAEKFLLLLNAWCERETHKALLNGQEAKASILSDKAECLRVVSSGMESLAQIILRLQTLFEPQNMNITCSTGHKAKGFEWPTVIHLDPWRIPSKYAQKQALEGNSVNLEQDKNLLYVIETRAQNTLILANSETMT
jgi:hypothetical protein